MYIGLSRRPSRMSLQRHVNARENTECSGYVMYLFVSSETCSPVLCTRTNLPQAVLDNRQAEREGVVHQRFYGHSCAMCTGTRYWIGHEEEIGDLFSVERQYDMCSMG